MAALLDVTVKATLLFGAAVSAIGLMRRASAASRHAVWMGFFVGIAALPVAALAVPTVPIRILAAETRPTASLVSVVARASAHPSVGPAQDSDAGPSLRTRAPESSLRPWSLNDIIIAMWIAGASLFLARMIVGAIGVRRLERRAGRTPSPDTIARVERARRLLRVRRRVEILTIDVAVMPATWGIWRPAVVLPADPHRALPSDVLDAVILHEIAHVARVDALAQGVTRLVTALFWFHPGVWIAQRLAHLERERACDDVVLRHGRPAATYATELVMLARALRPIGEMASGSLAAVRQSELERRVGDILNRRIDRRRASITGVMTAVALVVAAAPVAAMRPTSRAGVEAPASTATERPAVQPDAIARAIVPDQSERDESTDARTTGAAVVTASWPTDGAIQPVPQIPQALATDAPWDAARAGMYQQLVDRAQQLVDNSLAAFRIGTLAQIDVRDAQEALEKMTALWAANATSSPAAPTPAEQAAIRSRFAVALRGLDTDTTRFRYGLLSVRQFDDDLLAAADILRVQPHPESTEPAPLSATDFARALQAAANPGTDADRADALLALARTTVFTPDMVSRYVDAASRLAPSERDRVFAQPIRVTPPAGG